MDEDNYTPNTEEVQTGEIDSQQDIYEADQEAKEEQDLFGNIPVTKDRDSVFTFFKHLVGIKDTTRVSNIDPSRELGMLQFSIRTNKYLGLVGDICGDNDFADFWRQQSEIITSSAMSKKGWLVEVPQSQRRLTSRTVRPIRTESKGFLGLGKKSEPAAAQ
jgi:hypothetical protein